MARIDTRVWAVLALMLLWGMGMYAQPKRAKGHKSAEKIAREHIMYEEYEDAIPQLEALLETDPSSAYYNFWMGKSLYLTYRKNQALPYFQRVEQINPEVDDEFHYYYALTLHYNLVFDKAITEYQLEMERHEGNTPAYREINNRIQQCLFAQQLSKRKEGDLVKIENLGATINTPYSEHSPVISGNDSLLVFTARRPESLGAKPEDHFYDEDIYVANKSGKSWARGQNIGTPVNSKGHDATISLTNDGSRMYIYRHKKAGGLYVTDFDQSGKKWKEPVKVEKPLNSKFYEASICESSDGNTLFFTSDRPGGFGGRDIYRVMKEGSGWTEPQNLGPIINSSFDEDAPFFHPDNRTLYFSSNGPKSMGGFDIFVTELEGDTWLEPLNMGPPVNTPDDDIYFVLSESGLTGYYSSGKEGGFGEKDIYSIKFPYFRYPKRAYVIEVVGIVQDVESLDTLPAMVRLLDKSSNRVVDSLLTTPEIRQYSFEVEPERAYTIQVSADGYERNQEEFTTPELTEEDITMRQDVLLKRPIIIAKENNLPEIQHVYFDFDKSDLRAESRNELDMIAGMLRKNKDLSLKILGHTDYYGTFDYNVALSNRRSNAVIEYLVNTGVPRSRLDETWFSENKPIETNENDEGRQYNRRVEFKVVRNGDPLFSSVKLRKGAEGPWVDPTKPKGQPGYDNPDGKVFAQANQPETQDEYLVSDNAISSEPTNSVSSTAFNSNLESSTVEGIALHHIYFDYDKFNLRQESQKELDRLVDLLSGNPQYELEIRGHTDSDGNSTYNQLLSENRANSAYAYLVGRGVGQAQLKVTGFSEEKPIASNDNSTGKQTNRRVEFVLHKGSQTVVVSNP